MKSFKNSNKSEIVAIFIKEFDSVRYEIINREYTKMNMANFQNIINSKGSFQNSKPVKCGKPSKLRGWEMVFVRGGVKKHKITSHVLKLPP